MAIKCRIKDSRGRVSYRYFRPNVTSDDVHCKLMKDYVNGRILGAEIFVDGELIEQILEVRHG